MHKATQAKETQSAALETLPNICKRMQWDNYGFTHNEIYFAKSVLASVLVASCFCPRFRHHSRKTSAANASSIADIQPTMSQCGQESP